MRKRSFGRAASIYLSEEYLELLERLSIREGKSLSRIVREFLEREYGEELKRIREERKQKFLKEIASVSYGI